MPTYPTPTGQRIPYHRDGSTVVSMGIGYTGSPATYGPGDLDLIDSETPFAGSKPAANSPSWAVLFAHPWDLAGYFLATSDGDHIGSMQVTTDAVPNPQGGTWTTVQNPYVDNWNASITPAYRSGITAFPGAPLLGVTGVRFTTTGGTGVVLYNIHLYGTPSVGANPNSLRIWQPIANAEVATVEDFGDLAQGSTTVKTFRVKNLSSSQTAQGIVLSAEILTDASPSLATQYEFSTDNVNFFTTLNIGSLTPGQVSGVLYLRAMLPSGAELSVWNVWMIATPTAFA